jgi:ketosteroid isomerase-like protein
MSKENVEVFRQFIDTWQKNVAALRLFTDAFHRRDLDALLSCCDPDIEIGSGGVLIGTPVYRGHAGLEHWLRDVAVAWEELRNEPRHLMAVGDDALVVVGDAFGWERRRGSRSRRTTRPSI